jgi:hypothetical protein
VKPPVKNPGFEEETPVDTTDQYPVPSPPPKPRRRHGMRTSEFWIVAPVAFCAMAAALEKAFERSETPLGEGIAIAAGVISAGLAAAGYAVGRGLAKRGRDGGT